MFNGSLPVFRRKALCTLLFRKRKRRTHIPRENKNPENHFSVTRSYTGNNVVAVGGSSVIHVHPCTYISVASIVAIAFFHSIRLNSLEETAVAKQPRHLKSLSRSAMRLFPLSNIRTTGNLVDTLLKWEASEARNRNGPLFLSRQLKLLPSFPEHCPQRIVSSRAVIVSSHPSPLCLTSVSFPLPPRTLLVVQQSCPDSLVERLLAVGHNICLHHSSDSFSVRSFTKRFTRTRCEVSRQDSFTDD